MKKVFFLFFLLIFSTSEAKVFSDVNEYSWASSIVDKWSDRGIISGYIDGSFRGNNNLKRSEMITVINKLNNSSEYFEFKPARDVSESDWHYYEMSTALKNGLIDLDENYNLRPNDYATREEVFVILAKLFKLKCSGNSSEILSSKFSDYYLVDGQNYAYIAALIEEGYISGYNDNTLKPKKTITRAELLAIIDKMVEEIYTSGEIENITINGNIIINGENIKIKNVDIDGYIFVMDGAKKGAPVLTSVNCKNGLVSRIGQIFINDLEEKMEEKENVKPAFIRVSYSEKEWTNGEVKVTISGGSNYDVINNSGNKSYTFKENGEFLFLLSDKAGNITEFKAKVDNIDVVEPKFEVNINKQTDKALITLTVEEDGLSPIEGVYYRKGTVSSSNVVKYGELVTNNTFEIYEAGKYTIVVQDEAGNRTRKIVTVNFGS